jgi:hypothetical protein
VDEAPARKRWHFFLKRTVNLRRFMAFVFREMDPKQKAAGPI